MKGLRGWLDELDAARRSRATAAVALASGLMVGAGVTRFFLGFDRYDVPDLGTLALILLGGLLAFAFTSASTARALRAKTGGRAVAVVFAGNVVPPTLLFLPTVIGVFFAFPAGLVAFALVVPVALVGRSVIGEAGRASEHRAYLLAAATLAVGGLLFLSAGWAEGTRYYGGSVPHEVALVEAAPSLFLEVIAAVVALCVTLAEARRVRLGHRLGAGQVEGWRAGPPMGGARSIERVASVGDGPMRLSEVAEPAGVLVASSRRAWAGAAILLAGVFICALAAMAVAQA